MLLCKFNVSMEWSLLAPTSQIEHIKFIKKWLIVQKISIKHKIQT